MWTKWKSLSQSGKEVPTPTFSDEQNLGFSFIGDLFPCFSRRRRTTCVDARNIKYQLSSLCYLVYVMSFSCTRSRIPINSSAWQLLADVVAAFSDTSSPRTLCGITPAIEPWETLHPWYVITSGCSNNSSWNNSCVVTHDRIRPRDSRAQRLTHAGSHRCRK